MGSDGRDGFFDTARRGRLVSLLVGGEGGNSSPFYIFFELLGYEFKNFCGLWFCIGYDMAYRKTTRPTWMNDLEASVFFFFYKSFGRKRRLLHMF
jgi:hypothetical protein